MGLLDGTTGIVFGVANKRSIAWAIARALAGAGMRLAFTYQGDRLKENVEELAGTLPGAVCYPCDVGSDGEIAAVFAGVARDLGRLDTLVHSVAFAQREDLEGDFVATAREGFRVAHDVSAYSLVGLVRAALPLLEKSDQASVIAMTYPAPSGSLRATTSWAWPRPRSKPRCATSRRTSARKGSASTRSRPAPSTRWPRAGFAVSLTCSSITPRRRRSAATSNCARWGTRRSS